MLCTVDFGKQTFAQSHPNEIRSRYRLDVSQLSSTLGKAPFIFTQSTSGNLLEQSVTLLFLGAIYFLLRMKTSTHSQTKPFGNSGSKKGAIFSSRPVIFVQIQSAMLSANKGLSPRSFSSR